MYEMIFNKQIINKDFSFFFIAPSILSLVHFVQSFVYVILMQKSIPKENK